ncbi:AAA family ATPase [Zymobacter sp. IVIA_5232.4 C2]|uniref:AAA family ATPase n=1 Tax=Zymobacter sp. IVIA_5232.4 C2 TaxID=3394855 RepID=UPI0039C3A583
MKISLVNFGPIKNFTFDSNKSFHLIVGHNNVGKSYALTVYYIIFKIFKEMHSKLPPLNYVSNFFLSSKNLFSDEIYKNLEGLNPINEKREQDVRNNLTLFIKHFLTDLFIEEFNLQITNAYGEGGAVQNCYNTDPCEIEIEIGNISFLLKESKNTFIIDSVKCSYKKIILKKVAQNRNDKYDIEKLTIYNCQSKKKQQDPYASIGIAAYNIVHSAISSLIQRFGDIHYLPASRSGLYHSLTAFGQIIAELSKSRNFLSKKIELPGINRQVSDYFIKLSSIKKTRISPSREEFIHIAKRIENEVLGGTIEFDSNNKKLYYKPTDTQLKIDLSYTSSMISETGPIVAYVRHIMTSISRRKFYSENLILDRSHDRDRGQILIIEEPEAHLHPENQAKMTSIYAALSKLDVNIIITTHSNYIFNKVNNLIISKELDANNVECDCFIAKEDGSEVIHSSIDKYGIDDNNFVDIAESLFEEKMDLINKLEEQQCQ